MYTAEKFYIYWEKFKEDAHDGAHILILIVPLLDLQYAWPSLEMKN